jgi:hypothetical protein
MRHLVIICLGFAWSCLAVLLHLFFGLTWSEVPDIFPKFTIAGILTSYLVTFLFRRPLVLASSQKNILVPLATIPCGVSIWSILLFSFAAIQSLIGGRNDVFDGFWYFIFSAIVVSLTFALPITYPAAYLTQNLISRYGKAKQP